MATGLALDACKAGFTNVNSGLEQFFNDPANVNICRYSQKNGWRFKGG
jgi:hypothetical protein